MDKLSYPVLKLNANWVPFNTTTVEQSFKDVAAGAATFLRFIDDYPVIYRLEDWLNIEVEDKEDYIGVSWKLHAVRRVPIPRVIICVNYRDLVQPKALKPNLTNLRKRDQGIDQLTGEYIEDPKDGSVEHIQPRSKGGKTIWKNIAYTHKKNNSRRGNRSYSEFGFKVPKGFEPKPESPLAKIYNVMGYPEWKLFGIRDK